jgi:hypothetical protein
MATSCCCCLLLLLLLLGMSKVERMEPQVHGRSRLVLPHQPRAALYPRLHKL